MPEGCLVVLGGHVAPKDAVMAAELAVVSACMQCKTWRATYREAGRFASYGFRELARQVRHLWRVNPTRGLGACSPGYEQGVQSNAAKCLGNRQQGRPPAKARQSALAQS